MVMEFALGVSLGLGVFNFIALLFLNFRLKELDDFVGRVVGMIMFKSAHGKETFLKKEMGK